MVYASVPLKALKKTHNSYLIKCYRVDQQR